MEPRLKKNIPTCFTLYVIVAACVADADIIFLPCDF